MDITLEQLGFNCFLPLACGALPQPLTSQLGVPQYHCR